MSVMKRSAKTLVAAMACYIVLPTQTFAFEGSWHAGISAGVSLLSPETEGSSFTLDDDQSTAVSAYLGLDITSIISAEIAFTDLGEAELSDNQEIGYEAMSIGAMVYVLGETQALYRSEGPSAYLRLGLSAIDNESGVELDESNSTALWLGAGVQYPVSRNWGLRAELTSYDGDAQSIMAGVFWRMGVRSEQDSLPTAIAEPASTAEPVEVFPTDTTNPATRLDSTEAPVEPATVQIPDRSQVADPDSECPPDAAQVIANVDDCVLLNSVVAGLDFVGNTATVSSRGELALNRVVSALNAYPETVVEIRVHTQTLGDAQQENQLSAERAKSVARYLVQNGVPVSQLRAKAFGATQPIAADSTFNGRQRNNRVELKTL